MQASTQVESSDEKGKTNYFYLLENMLKEKCMLSVYTRGRNSGSPVVRGLP